jgi:hypothetical protein
MLERGRRRFHRTEHVNLRKFAPVAPFDDPTNVKPLSREQFQDLVKTAESKALKIASEIRAAGISAVPGSHCAGCEFNDICRTTVIEGHDGERTMLST